MAKKTIKASYHEDRDIDEDSECIVLMFTYKRFGTRAEWLTKKEVKFVISELQKSLNPPKEEEDET